ncbi:thermonuclease family protein [Desulfonauticus submarinus]
MKVSGLAANFRILFRRLFVACIFFYFLFFGFFAEAKCVFVFPRGVADGDTVFLSNGLHLRLALVDAPEMNYKGGLSQYYAKKSKNFLWHLIKHRQLCLRNLTKDRFGRLLAQAYLEDGKWINFLLIRKGYAFYFPHKGEFNKILLRAQRLAMQEKVGFWKRILSLPAATQVFLGNKKSRRFHTLECKFGRKISFRHRRMFSSLYEAFYFGYAPARCCTIWPLEE